MLGQCDCINLAVLAGLPLDCCPNIGGITEVYLALYSDIVGKPTVTDGVITGITLKDGANWYKYEFRKNTGSMTSTLNVDSTNGNNYITTEVALVFSRMDTKKRIEMSALTVGAVVAVVKDANGGYWYLGFDEYVSASAGTGETGTDKADRNAYTITLSTDSKEWPYELDDATSAAVEASAAAAAASDEEDDDENNL